MTKSSPDPAQWGGTGVGTSHGCHGSGSSLVGWRTWMRTSTDVPSGNTAPPASTAILTGTYWVTLVKLPEALLAGSSENVAALAGEIASTCPQKSRFSASTWISTGCPARTRQAFDS